ncbi:hypothetical protein FE68_15420, partial [Staphylococcus aureus]
EQEQPDLLLDAAHAFQYLPLSNQSLGEQLYKAINTVTYAATAVGNHELDFGYDKLKKFKGMLDFPMLRTNVYKNGKRSFKHST